MGWVAGSIPLFFLYYNTNEKWLAKMSYYIHVCSNGVTLLLIVNKKEELWLTCNWDWFDRSLSLLYTSTLFIVGIIIVCHSYKHKAIIFVSYMIHTHSHTDACINKAFTFVCILSCSCSITSVHSFIGVHFVLSFRWLVFQPMK